MATRPGRKKDPPKIKKERRKLPVQKPAPIVQSYADAMGNNLAGIKAVARKIRGFLTEATTTNAYISAYNDASVSKLLSEEKIPVLFSYKGMKKRPRWGCYPISRVLYDLLKVKGYKPRLVRYFLDGSGPLPAQKSIVMGNSKASSFKMISASSANPHTSIFFQFEGKLYNLDAFFQGVLLHEVTPNMLEELKKLHLQKKFEYIRPGQISFDEYLHERATGKI